MDDEFSQIKESEKESKKILKNTFKGRKNYFLIFFTILLIIGFILFSVFIYRNYISEDLKEKINEIIDRNRVIVKNIDYFNYKETDLKFKNFCF